MIENAAKTAESSWNLNFFCDLLIENLKQHINPSWLASKSAVYASSYCQLSLP